MSRRKELDFIVRDARGNIILSTMLYHLYKVRIYSVVRNPTPHNEKKTLRLVREFPSSFETSNCHQDLDYLS